MTNQQLKRKYFAILRKAEKVAGTETEFNNLIRLAQEYRYVTDFLEEEMAIAAVSEQLSFNFGDNN